MQTGLRFALPGNPVGMIQILPGHGWLDVVGILLMFAVAIGGFFTGLALLISRADPDANGVPAKWPSRNHSCRESSQKP